LGVVVCVGEPRVEGEAGLAKPVVEAQWTGSLPDAANPENLVIAYEPVWAIGTGLTPTMADIADMHAAIRTRIPSETRMLYGGSANPKTARQFSAREAVRRAMVGGR